MYATCETTEVASVIGTVLLLPIGTWTMAILGRAGRSTRKRPPSGLYSNQP